MVSAVTMLAVTYCDWDDLRPKTAASTKWQERRRCQIDNYGQSVDWRVSSIELW